MSSILGKARARARKQQPAPSKNGEASKKKKKPKEKQPRTSQADALVGLAEAADLFHADDEAYATIKVDDHFETWPLASKGFRRWLSRVYFKEKKKAPGAQALQDAIGVLGGIAVFDKPQKPVAVRLAEHGGCIWLDLADQQWRTVCIAEDGWGVGSCPPVKFIRRRGMLSLPVPEPGGSVDELRQFVNLPDDDSWVLLVAWLVNALRPGKPFPILALNGEQGSAKSTLCRMARAMIDPNTAPLRRPPRDDRDLMIAATNGWIVAYDNLSGVKPDLSDALCSLATGGGLSTRELYSDAEEKLFDAMRPVALNGIEEICTRPDLADRSICLTLPTIGDTDRRDEANLWREFERVRPRVLGALLSAVSAALRRVDDTKLEAKPRMADFALWITAAEPALPWGAGDFLRAYLANRADANTTAIDGSLLAGPILQLADQSGVWKGTAAALLEALDGLAGEKTVRRQEWPKSPRKMSGDLRRLAPALRRAGVEITFERVGHSRQRTIRLEQVGKTPSAPSAPSATAENTGFACGRSAGGVDGIPSADKTPSADRPPHRPHETTQKHEGSPTADGADGADGVLQARSNSHEEEPWEKSPWE